MLLDQIKFTVCMSVYKNDNPVDFKSAVVSIYTEQTIRPSEIVLVVDGPISDTLNSVIIQLKENIPVLRVIELERNMGHAIARQTGLDAAKNELVAVMDADDLAVSNRFELQLKVFASYPDVSVVGGIINEFIDTILLFCDSPTNRVGTKINS